MAVIGSLDGVAPPAFHVVLEIRYATAANTTEVPIYARPTAYLHEEVAICLEKAAAKAVETGHLLVIHDAIRFPEGRKALDIR